MDPSTHATSSIPRRDTALQDLLQYLASQQYRFITPTPATHARALARSPRKPARSLTDIFGWSLPFDSATIGEELKTRMQAAHILIAGEDGDYRSAIRVSSLDDALFIHSAYPTLASDAIFFGPDTYRFVRFARQHLPSRDPNATLRCVDIGCGSGAGGISVARCLPGSQWRMTDINPQALEFTAINARHAGVSVETQLSDVLRGSEDDFDLVICNPPYLEDPQGRAYRHGGGSMGSELSLRIAREAFDRLNTGGRLLLYTGVAIVDGEDGFLAELRAYFEPRDCLWTYEEIDPDVFSEELEQPAYARADRIAAVGLVVTRT